MPTPKPARRRPQLRQIPSRFWLPGIEIRVYHTSRKNLRKMAGEDVKSLFQGLDGSKQTATVWLRRDRTYEQRVDDLGHEMIHLTLDWWNWALGKDRVDVRP